MSVMQTGVITASHITIITFPSSTPSRENVISEESLKGSISQHLSYQDIAVSGTIAKAMYDDKI